MTTANIPAHQPQPRVSMASFLSSPKTANFLEETLKEKKPEFVSNLITLCDADANLAQCDPAALMKCAMNATALNLPLNKNLGYAYVIPYNVTVGNVKVMTPNFQIGYKGFIQLAIRTGQYRFINATEIRENEIKHNKITGEITFLGENPNGKIVGYMAYLELITGFTASLYMTEEQLEAHAKRFSKMYAADIQYKSAKSKWSDPEARPTMCKKTVLKNLLGTYGLMTTEFARAFASDNDETDSNSTYSEAQIIPQEEPGDNQPPQQNGEGQKTAPKKFNV
jgi:recombination protein RecT